MMCPSGLARTLSFRLSLRAQAGAAHIGEGFFTMSMCDCSAAQPGKIDAGRSLIFQRPFCSGR